MTPQKAPRTDVPSIRVLGSRVHLVSVEQTGDQIERWISARDGYCHRVIATGFHGLLEGYKDPALLAILNGAELWAPDGIAPLWAARLLGYRNVQRAPGPEIMLEFLRRANEKGYSSYFYGDTESTLNALRRKVLRDFPKHRIAGMFSPPFRTMTTEENDHIVEKINAARPDVLWVALGAPKQDLWIYDRLPRLNVPVAIGVGAAFAFVSGAVPRCPQWIGRAGFEWAYRLMREPKKLWRRDLIDGPRFLFRLGLELATRGNQKEGR